MVGTLLAMGFGLNVPHASAGIQVKFTSGFCGPLVTTAAMPAVALVSSIEGGAYWVLNVTTIAGGTYAGSPPHASSAAIIGMTIAPLAINLTVDWRKVMESFDASGETEV